MNTARIHDLLLQSLEHEMGGVKVYETALECAVNDELREEWTKYLAETRTHVDTLRNVCAAFGLDPDEDVPSRKVVRTIGTSLVKAMEGALDTGDSEAAELVACEAVVLAETKDHMDWELLSACADELTGAARKALKSACEEVEDQEDAHLYHTKGWCRELWLQSLGLPAVLPPPEEEKDVKTAADAARAEQSADKTRKRSAKR
jgi:rubrerythrin